MRATTAQLYPGRETFKFDQGHVTKNQPITKRILSSESLAVYNNNIPFSSIIYTSEYKFRTIAGGSSFKGWKTWTTGFYFMTHCYFSLLVYCIYQLDDLRYQGAKIWNAISDNIMLPSLKQFKVLLWSKNSLLFFLQILKACLFDTSLAKSWASNFI